MNPQNSLACSSFMTVNDEVGLRLCKQAFLVIFYPLLYYLLNSHKIFLDPNVTLCRMIRFSKKKVEKNKGKIYENMASKRI